MAGLDDSFRNSLLEQIRRLANALELAELENYRIHSLYYAEIVRSFGLDEAQRIAIAVGENRAAASASVSPRSTLLSPATIISPPSETYNIPNATPSAPPLTPPPTPPPTSPFSQTFDCPICLDSKSDELCVTPCECGRQFCRDCITRMLGVITDESGNLPIPCPTCPKSFETDECVKILSGTKWGDKFASLIAEKLYHNDIRYCANERCGAPFDWVKLDHANQHPNQSLAHCPLCNTRTCVDCRTIWHDGQTCEEFKHNELDANAVGALAARNNWTPCPTCNSLIEKHQGDCNFVKCNCGTAFCFNCATPYVNTNPSAGNGHGEPGCGCGLFDNHRRPRARARLRTPRIVMNAIRQANRREHGNSSLRGVSGGGGGGDIQRIGVPRKNKSAKLRRRRSVSADANNPLRSGRNRNVPWRNRAGVPRNVGNRRGQPAPRGNADQSIVAGHVPERPLQGAIALSDESVYSYDSSSSSSSSSTCTSSAYDTYSDSGESFAVDTSDDDSTRTWVPHRARRGIAH